MLVRNWRLLIGSAALATAVPAVDPAPAAGAATVSRPNIIVIIADDLGYADVSTYREGRFATPNIDRIGREGAVFTQGYVAAPICSPSRAALMTGRHQQRFGFEYNNGPGSRDARDRLGLAVGERTIADVLHQGGYRTGAIGKWHLGWNEEHYPTNRGFDYFWGFLTGQTNFIRPDAPEAVNALPPRKAPPQPAAPSSLPALMDNAPAAAAGATGNTGGDLVQPYDALSRFNAPVTGRDRTPVDLGDSHMTDVMADQAIDFVDAKRGQPFFLYLAHNAPHTPLQTTRTYFDRFPQIADRTQRVYAAMVSQLDASIGKLLDHLDRTGLAKNTIVIFLSDNGCAAYIAGLCSPDPLAGGKLTYLEGGVRVPFMIRWPGHVAPGTVHGTPVSSMDIFPTLTAAAGQAMLADRPYDGQDLIGQLEAPAKPRHAALYWRTQPIEAMRDGDWKYIHDLDGAEFLYDLRTDPRETRNLAAAEPERLADMRRRYATWQTAMVAPLWTGRYEAFVFGGRPFKFKP